MEPTFIAACRPSDDSEWRLRQDELEEVLGRKFRNTSVLKIGASQAWVRVTFPYYLDSRELNKLAASLADNTK
jgi:hypothetical protein